MVGVSYHELQASSTAANGGRRPRDSAGTRKQFLVVCILGAAVCANAFINGGIFEEVVIKDDGIYPGGDYIYKVIEDRDFATTGGIWRLISKDLQPDKDDLLDLNNNDSSEEVKFDDSLFSVYVDEIEKGKNQGRYFSGILIDNSKKELKKRLLEKNKSPPSAIDLGGMEELFYQQKYQVGDLPSVRCAVTTFPFTDGFISALMHNYKVFPALVRYAKANLDPKNKLIISTNCDRALKVCKHYMPMVQSKKFLMGHPDTEEYLNSKPKQELDVATLIKGVKKLLKF